MSGETEYNPSHWSPSPLLQVSSVFLAGSLVLLARRLYWPVVLKYPWPACSTEARACDKAKKIIFAGSFNPPHHGHLAMLRYLAQRYDEVIAVVGVNPSKKYLVAPDERAAIIKEMVERENVNGKIRVEVVSGYIWRFAMKERASLMFRGIRSWEKDGKEERFLHLLNLCGPIILGPLIWPLPTHFLEGKPEYNHISSTLIRNMCVEGRRRGNTPDLAKIVPDSVAAKVAAVYSKSL